MVSYGVSECTTGPILFDMTIFEISTLSPIPNLGFEPYWTKIEAKLEERGEIVWY